MRFISDMANILLIDSNPEHRKSLGGLLRHRTSHTVRIVEKNIEGVRAASTDQPDLIMVNALLFMDKNYGLPRVLQQNEKTASIPFLIHTSTDLGEVVQRQIEASGVAGVLELPVSASELQAGIDGCLELKSEPKRSRKGVQEVQWDRIEEPSVPTSKSSPESAGQGEAAETSHKGKRVKSVTWPTANPSEIKSRKKARGSSPPRRQASADFRKMDSPESGGGSGGFQAASFQDIGSTERVVGEDSDRDKSFKQKTSWNSVDPGQVKNKNRKRKE